MFPRALLLVLVIGACTQPVEPPSAIGFRILAGDDQVGRTSEYAPLPLVVLAEDAAGNPLAGLPIAWDNVVNGRVIPLMGGTSATGRAEALFVFGDSEGLAEVTARVPGGTPIRFRLRVVGSSSGVPYDAVTPLAFSTYDGSGETVHPDYARTPAFGFSQLLALTPYPGGNAAYENPSVFAGESPVEWPIPPGAVNPLALPSGSGHLSDPDLVFVEETRELRLYYRAVDSRNRILVLRSDDGIRWGSPREVAAVPNPGLISPSVVYRGPADWWMWSIDGGTAGCSAEATAVDVRRSADGLTWSPPVAVPLAHDGLTPWHIDVQWIPSRREFWAVYNAKQPGSCTTPALFLATSPDGLSWTPVRGPLVRKGVIPAFKDIIYRTTFRYDPDTDDLWLWISGARYGSGRWVWSTAVQRRRAAEALHADTKGTLTFEAPPAELTDWP